MLPDLNTIQAMDISPIKHKFAPQTTFAAMNIVHSLHLPTLCPSYNSIETDGTPSHRSCTASFQQQYLLGTHLREDLHYTFSLPTYFISFCNPRTPLLLFFHLPISSHQPVIIKPPPAETRHKPKLRHRAALIPYLADFHNLSLQESYSRSSIYDLSRDCGRHSAWMKSSKNSPMALSS